MNESELRERMHEWAARVPPPGPDPARIAGRGARRAARTIVAGIAAVALIAAGVFAAARTIQPDRPARLVTPPTTTGACDGPGLHLAQVYGTVNRIAGRYPTNVRNLIRWLYERSGPDEPRPTYGQWHQRDGDDAITVCVYEGLFDVPKGPPGGTPPPRTALSIFVPDREQPRLDSVGPGPFDWAYTPAPPGCHEGEPGCDELGLCKWETEAALPCGNGVEQGRAYRYRLWGHCGIRQAWFDGRLWQTDPPVDAPSDMVEGTMTLIAADEARFQVPGLDPITFRAQPPPTPALCD
ncbi:MAG TPA: hypothetical protein VGB64_03375 [Actinomycetota bacterium]